MMSGRDNFDYDFDDEPSAGGKSRGRNRVFVDDGIAADDDGGPRGGYGAAAIDDDLDGGFGDERGGRRGGGFRDSGRSDARAVVPHDPRSTAPAHRRRSAAVAPAPSGRGVWMTAIFATLLWMACVFAYVFAAFAVPIDSFDGALNGFMGLPGRVLLMSAAVAVAPVGLIIMSASVARRAQRISAAAEQMQAGGGGGSAEIGGLERAEEVVMQLEERFAALQEQAAAAQAHAERERQAIEELVASLDGKSDRFATDLADKIARNVGAAAPAAAAASAAPRSAPDAPARPQKPAGAERQRASFGGNDAIAAAAEKARGAVRKPLSGQDRFARDEEASGEQGEASARGSRLDDLRRRLESRGGGRGGSAARPSLADFDDAPAERDEFDDFDAQNGDGERDEPGFDYDQQESSAENGGAGGGELDWARLVRAANFPDSEDDRETLDALYAVLTDPEAAKLLQTAEDALSALADIDLYMEDMQPHHAPAERWRAFIVDSDRTDALDLGGIRDAHAIEDVAAAYERSAEFSQASERFMDHYEAILERLFHEAPSAKLAVELADTRSGRAYMLLARASGRFG